MWTVRMHDFWDEHVQYGLLNTTIDEASAELEKRWADSVAAYDVVRAHALVMADALAKGMT